MSETTYSWQVGAVVDASVLIGLAKIRKLEVLPGVFGEVLMSPTVKVEVIDRGRQTGWLQAGLVEASLQEGWLSVAELTAEEQVLVSRISRTAALHSGETESLALAKARGRLLVVDEKEARAVAQSMDLPRVGTAAVLLEACTEGLLGLAELEEAVLELARAMWVGPDVVAEIMRRAREVAR